MFTIIGITHDGSGDSYIGILRPDKTLADVIRAVHEAKFPYFALKDFISKSISDTYAAELEQSAECSCSFAVTLYPEEMEISVYFTGGISEIFRNDRNSKIVTFCYPYRDGQVR